MNDPQLIIANSLEVADLPKEVNVPGTDVRHLVVESLGIGEVRKLINDSLQKPLELSHQHFVIVTKTLTTEAQNALLKLFEEPPETARFYLVIPHESLLLPTLRSRFISVTATTADEAAKAAEDFLNLKYADRMTFIAERVKAKDSTTLERLAVALGQQSDDLSPESKQSLLLVEKYVRNRGASRKMLLEELALSLPT